MKPKKSAKKEPTFCFIKGSPDDLLSILKTISLLSYDYKVKLQIIQMSEHSE